MRKWYKKRGGYVKLPRIPWTKRPSWYRKPPVRFNPYKPKPWHLPMPNNEPPPMPEWAQKKLEKSKVKSAIKKKHRVKRVTTIAMSSDQKKLLEMTKPKQSRKKNVQSPKGARPTRERRTTQLESQKQNNSKQISADKMPRRKRRMTKRMFRAKRPVTRLKRWLRPLRKRTKARMPMIQSGGRGATFSSFYSKKKFKKNKRKYVLSTYPWNKRVEVKSFKVTSTFGSQAVFGDSKLEWLTLSDMANLASMLTTANKTATFLVESVKAEIMISNMSKATVYVDIYEYSYRKDSDNDISNLFTNGLQDAYGSTAVDRSTLFMTPFMSPRLTSAIKIDSVKRIELSQGASHIHKSVRKINRIWNEEDRYFSSSERIADWTTGTMFIQRGEPVNSKTTTTDVSTSSTACDYIVKEETTMKFAEPLIKQLIYSNTLPTISTGQLLDEGSGEVEDVVAA